MQRSTITQMSNNIVRTAQGMDGMDVLLREISRINETLDVYYSMALNSTSDERSTHVRNMNSLHSVIDTNNTQFWEKLWNKYMSTDWIVEQAKTPIAAIIMLVGVCNLYSIHFRKTLRREQRYPYEDCQVIAWSLFGIGTGLYLSAEDDIMNHGIRLWLGTIGVLLSLVGYVFLRRRREARIIRYGPIVLDFEYHIFTIDGKPLTQEHSEVLIELLRAILRADARRREIGRKIRYNRCLIRINKRRIQELKKRKAQRRIKPTME
ncbi:hypothetical protein B0J14DRAFT_115812 [Halenospora varia]|nr:hypothetical protein B0J14DRAFT_115812 [Halenospora varia]